MPRSEPRPPARMSEAALAEAAVFYLSRYASSSGNLRQVLRRKLVRSARHYGDDPEPLMAAIDALVARHVANGAVNDANFAETQIRKLRRRGGSGRAILQRLAAKGVPADVIAETGAASGGGVEDIGAAIQLARRRRLGPFRDSRREDHRQRDMAILGRAGFDYATAAKIVDAADADALTELLILE
jgi:regulatory protein